MVCFVVGVIGSLLVLLNERVYIMFFLRCMCFEEGVMCIFLFDEVDGLFIVLVVEWVV